MKNLVNYLDEYLDEENIFENVKQTKEKFNKKAFKKIDEDNQTQPNKTYKNKSKYYRKNNK
jgi:hypothetical protein